MQPTIIIHTDGSASTHKYRPGGWAFVARFNDQEATRCGRADGTTISVMEITAIVRSMEFLLPQATPVIIHSDSQYAVNALTVWGDQWEESDWRTATGKKVQHVALIKHARELIRLHRELRTIDIRWVRGHAGVADNHLADDLAGQARRYPKAVTWTADDSKFLRHLGRLQHSQSNQRHAQHHTTEGAVRPTRRARPLPAAQ